MTRLSEFLLLPLLVGFAAFVAEEEYPACLSRGCVAGRGGNMSNKLLSICLLGFPQQQAQQALHSLNKQGQQYRIMQPSTPDPSRNEASRPSVIIDTKLRSAASLTVRGCG